MTAPAAPSLPEFLSARADEIEALAKAAYPGGWYTAPGAKGWTDLAAEHTQPNGDWSDRFIAQLQVKANAEHIARHDPAAALADAAAIRRIVEWCSEREKIYVGTYADDAENPRPEHFVDGPLTHRDDAVVLRILAARWADHEDYDESWRL